MRKCTHKDHNLLTVQRCSDMETRWDFFAWFLNGKMCHKSKVMNFYDALDGSHKRPPNFSSKKLLHRGHIQKFRSGILIVGHLIIMIRSLLFWIATHKIITPISLQVFLQLRDRLEKIETQLVACHLQYSSRIWSHENWEFLHTCNALKIRQSALLDYLYAMMEFHFTKNLHTEP